jgi:hypothetical protein
MQLDGFVRQSSMLAVLTAVLACPGVVAAQDRSADAPDGPFDNLSFFVGPDGSKQPQDLGINANMGIRLSANWGFPILRSANLGAQVGIGFNASDAAVHVLDQIDGTSRRTQTFLTLGVFQRPTDRLNWGLVYDGLREHYYDNFNLGQLRGQVGIGLTSDDEVGAWFTRGVKGDEGAMGGTAVHVDPITQINGYTRHTWANAAQTTVWVGVAEGHHEVVWVFPDNSENKHVLVYGAQLYFPLSEKFAVTGAANLVTPTATGTVDAYLGVAFFPGRGALRASSNRFAPLAPVGNNPEMPVNLHR